MAEIDIQKKSSSPIWPWILALLALIVVLAYVFWFRDDETETAVVPVSDTTATTTATNTGTLSEPVNTYVSWVGDMDNKEMGLDHEFTHNGLTNLADALAAVADQAEGINRSQFDGKLNVMKARADEITRNWKSGKHGDMIKDAFRASADVMGDLQQTSFPELQQDVATVTQQINDMDTSTLTLDQRKQVKDVFRAAADVVRKMDMQVD
ncbi:hypothetical protein BN8_05258 [Fibrisoma limi BUZ 3]|uniref:Uncharacterized protein n=1 Tax=Fibrisoma limi BUZ 3 TaxID=1185876 RepID=I2GPY0_9BACT|nr:hypothetical protein [Fibrisoma limi]CCH55958.1 hypothetical protein BN8_05258 [Fibrisoma limi BUZ 3]